MCVPKGAVRRRKRWRSKRAAGCAAAVRRYAAVARNDKGPGRGTRGRESAVREGIEAIGIRLRPRDVGA